MVPSLTNLFDRFDPNGVVIDQDKNRALSVNSIDATHQRRFPNQRCIG